mgnify:CR=1 FL=1
MGIEEVTAVSSEALYLVIKISAPVLLVSLIVGLTISIFQYKNGVNAKPGDPNYDLKQLALKSMSKRIYPNWCNGNWSQAHEDENNPDTFFSTMGCRTLVGYDRHGLGYIRQGRGNNVPNTIILPKLGIEYGICLGKRDKADLDGFWNGLENALHLCEKGLLERYELIKKQSPKSAPFMYQNHTMKGSGDCVDTVENAVKHNTLGFGLIGVIRQRLVCLTRLSTVFFWLLPIR